MVFSLTYWLAQFMWKLLDCLIEWSSCQPIASPRDLTDVFTDAL